MTLFAYLDTLTEIAGPEAVAAARRQAGPIQEGLAGDTATMDRWDALAGRQNPGTAGRIRYGALATLTAYAISGKVDRSAVRALFQLAGLDGHGRRFGHDDNVPVPVEDIIAADALADAAFGPLPTV